MMTVVLGVFVGGKKRCSNTTAGVVSRAQQGEHVSLLSLDSTPQLFGANV